MRGAVPAATIFALSSGRPPAGIATIRVSGPGAAAAVRRIAGPLPPPRHATLRAFVHPADGAVIDRGLLLWFPGPASVTGEDLAEFHLHGGRAVGDAMLALLARESGLRLAEPGEFTRRAFANGRIDLLEAEGLADLLAAETEAQRRQAIGRIEGLRRYVEQWRDRLLTASALIEAALDFADEDDAGSAPAVEAGRAQIAKLVDEIDAALAAPPAERLRDGIRVVLAGPPNAGKSMLLNALAGRDAAIVSPIAGTTRDIIEVPVAIGGLPFVLSDTAGLRDSFDPVEAMGIERARRASDAADLLLWLGSPDDAPRGALQLHAKADLGGELPGMPVSALTGAGIPALRDWMVAAAQAMTPREGEAALDARQREVLAGTAAALRAAVGHHDLLLVAEELRRARAFLDRLTGRAGVEDLLDALFGRFCLGK